MPTFWFRNTWSWGYEDIHPSLQAVPRKKHLAIRYEDTDDYQIYYEGEPELLFCDNETNLRRLYKRTNTTPYPTDGIHEYVVQGDRDAVNPALRGTKVALHYQAEVAPGEAYTVQIRLQEGSGDPWSSFEPVFQQRQQEADTFYQHLQKPDSLDEDQRRIQRQAYAGMLWSQAVLSTTM